MIEQQFAIRSNSISAELGWFELFLVIRDIS